MHFFVHVKPESLVHTSRKTSGKASSQKNPARPARTRISVRIRFDLMHPRASRYSDPGAFSIVFFFRVNLLSLPRADLPLLRSVSLLPHLLGRPTGWLAPPAVYPGDVAFIIHNILFLFVVTLVLLFQSGPAVAARGRSRFALLIAAASIIPPPRSAQRKRVKPRAGGARASEGPRLCLGLRSLSSGIPPRIPTPRLIISALIGSEEFRVG